jgi:hypothetical protein
VRIFFLFISLFISAFAASAAFGQEAQQPPQIPNQQQSEPVPQSPPAAAPVAPAPPPVATPGAAPAPAGSAAAELRPRGEEGTEYWPPIRGYRLKVTDTLIAVFTALLFWAVWVLWRAIRRLIQNAERSSERQLRAYLAVVPKTVAGFRPNVAGKIEWVVKNLGQTPAQKVRHRYNFAVLPHPLPPRHKFAEPAREIANAPALLPRDETTISFDGEAFTAQQVEAVSRNEARIYCWGTTEYEDVFRVTWQTRFSVSVGGEAFSRAVNLPADHPSAPPWSWEYGSGHNEIEQAR